MEDLVPETYDLEYHVRVKDDGTAEIFFPSMTQMETDYAMGNDSSLVFTSVPKCWFH